MSYVHALKCRECARTYPAQALHACEFCFGPLEVEYDYEAMRTVATRESIAAGPPSIWRYADLLPVQAQGPVSLGAGFTPLVRADRLAAELGLGELFVKDDTRNPTGSFKDRVVSVALTKARELGFKVAACASTGNLANSVAAHAARAGMDSVVLIPSDLEAVKVITTAVFGGQLLAVEGNYDDVNRLCAELASEYPEWAFVNVNVRPYYAEGSKTLAFEVAEQLGWQLPDHVVVPIASGSQLTKIDKGFRELVELGLVAPRAGLDRQDPSGPVRVSGAQADGCSPVATAFAAGADDVKPVKPSTIAKSLAIGNPADGWYALEVVRRTGGSIESVSDQEILEGIRLLAKTEGIFAETAGGVTIATLAKLARAGLVRDDESVVVYVTGSGLKTVEAFGDSVALTATVRPRLDDVTAALEHSGFLGAGS
ncbi:MAG: threonine synthase [Acidimicrobiales bacterium]